MRIPYTWSKSFHGVQHLTPVKPGSQITLESYGSFVKVYELNLNSKVNPHPFTPVWEREFTNVAEAMRAGERQAHYSLVGV